MTSFTPSSTDVVGTMVIRKWHTFDEAMCYHAKQGYKIIELDRGNSIAFMHHENGNHVRVFPYTGSTNSDTVVTVIMM